MAENNEIKVKSLQKALEILNLFTEKPVLGVTEVSEYFGLYKSTVHNILLHSRQWNIWNRMKKPVNTGWGFRYLI